MPLHRTNNTFGKNPRGALDLCAMNVTDLSKCSERGMKNRSGVFQQNQYGLLLHIVLGCADEKLYVGSTNDLRRRFAADGFWFLRPWEKSDGKMGNVPVYPLMERYNGP